MNCPENILSVRNLTIHRGGVSILKNINWTVKKGDHWVILGANGSGKTSLLKSVAGYMTPSEGEITALGEEYGGCDWRELRKHIGVVSASISQLIHEEDIALDLVAGGRNAMIGVWGRVAPAEFTRARRLLATLGAAYLKDRPWDFLSQGERQRVLIARALMADPAILILDEPCAGLDPVAREEFLRDIKKLAAKQTAPALILVTHHIEEILPSFTHVLTLRKGRITYSGRKSGALTKAVLGEVFGARVALEKSRGRYQLSVKPRGS